jgi:hypothetical protein
MDNNYDPDENVLLPCKENMNKWKIEYRFSWPVRIDLEQIGHACYCYEFEMIHSYGEITRIGVYVYG